ncbi:MAG TPA: class IIb bacteriocin, lactobin A/cerein 7B family [Planctomycetota bacterium]|nr:class IIb bacteriocin, lactobin A/cerein 7B family [Planctomycetota bacterium]
MKTITQDEMRTVDGGWLPILLGAIAVIAAINEIDSALDGIRAGWRQAHGS